MILFFALQAAEPPLNLTCFGQGTANKVSMATINSRANAYGSVGTVPYSGSGNASSNIYLPRQQDFQDQVDLRLFAGDDRIRIPSTMLPPIRGGEAGWFKIKKLVADERSIKGKAAVNFMNNPNIHIDRVAGTITISGKAGDFFGRCQAVDANTKPQF